MLVASVMEDKTIMLESPHSHRPPRLTMRNVYDKVQKYLKQGALGQTPNNAYQQIMPLPHVEWIV